MLSPRNLTRHAIQLVVRADLQDLAEAEAEREASARPGAPPPAASGVTVTRATCNLVR